MAELAKSLGRRRDWPQLEGINLNAQAGAGSGADYEHPICLVPNLSQITPMPSGAVGDLPVNAMSLRCIYLIFEANITGANTNNFTLNVLQRRAGALLVNTTISAVASTGSQTVTPAAMTNIFVGTSLNIAAGGGSAETVVVTAVTATTFTATFASTHNASTACTSTPLATITYASGTNATAYVPVYLQPLAGNILSAGDIVTIQRVSLGTGLASPACTVTLEWVPARINA